MLDESDIFSVLGSDDDSAGYWSDVSGELLPTSVRNSGASGHGSDADLGCGLGLGLGLGLGPASPGVQTHWAPVHGGQSKSAGFAPESAWRDEVALVMNAFRSCRTDDLTSLVPSISLTSLDGKGRTSEVEQVKEIEAWRRELGTEGTRRESTPRDAGYTVTSRFRFP